MYHWLPWIKRSLLVLSNLYLVSLLSLPFDITFNFFAKVIGLGMFAVSLWLYANARHPFLVLDDLKKGNMGNILKLIDQHSGAVRQGLYTAAFLLILHGVSFVISGGLGCYSTVVEKSRPLIAVSTDSKALTGH